MNHRYIIVTTLALVAFWLSSCHLNLNNHNNGNGGNEQDTVIYKIATSSKLPPGLSVNTLKAKANDIDGDGDDDIILAVQYQRNKILINDGSGHFSDESASRLPAQQYDTRDLAIADFNSDGNPDLLFVNNQNQNNELYINGGKGKFSDLSNRIPVTGTFTTVATADINGNGIIDIMIGGVGQNLALINNGNAFFTNQTTDRLPGRLDKTQDITFADITGDGQLDIVVANEDANRALINAGSGFFTDQTSSRIPFINEIEETRDINIADLNFDGTFDLFFGNSGFQSGSNAQDRLLINNGSGVFSDQTSERLPSLSTDTFDAAMADLDKDGDLDLIVGNYNGGVRILINNGSGYFADQTASWIPGNFYPHVADIEVADYNRDGSLDIYLAVHDGQDQLLLHK